MSSIAGESLSTGPVTNTSTADRKFRVWDSRTWKAWKESVSHWEEVLLVEYPEAIDIHGSGCAFCRLFCVTNSSHSALCVGCPISEFTGASSCRESPWLAASLALLGWKRAVYEGLEVRFGYKEKFRECARAELDFLRSLPVLTGQPAENVKEL